MTAPRYLFRCYSDQSNGTNTPSLFAPGSLSDHDIAEHNQDFISLSEPSANISFGEQLRQALLWKKDQPKCPFMFFTTSPIFCFQLAIWRISTKTFKDGTSAEPDTNVNITIIDTTTAKMKNGDAVQFQSVTGLLQTHGVELRNRSDSSLREYADVWVPKSEVVPGAGSYHASLQSLIDNGFYELYPQIEVANDRRDPRPSLTTDDLRKYHFSFVDMVGKTMSTESLDTAARVAMCFQPNTADHAAAGGNSGNRMGPPMAFVLSLRKHNLEDPAFQIWLKEHTQNAQIDREPTKASEADASDYSTPDAASFATFLDHFDALSFQLDTLAFGLSIGLSTIERAKEDWTRWWKNNRDEYRATHPRAQRQTWRQKRNDRPRELLERRARRDSVMATQPPTKGLAHEQPRELFPGYRLAEPAQQQRYQSRYRRTDGGLMGRLDNAFGYGQGSGQGQQGYGYRVISSRPGDGATTRHQHRCVKELRRRDQDGDYATRSGY